MATPESKIPTIARTIEQGKFANNTYSVWEMSDGNFRAGIYVLDDQGYEWYQNGRYFRTEDEARDFVRQNLARLNEMYPGR